MSNPAQSTQLFLWSLLFETFYKELIQELLSDHEGYFISKQTTYSAKVNELFGDNSLLTYEEIQDRLNLHNRFRYYDFLQEYAIILFSNEEKEIIEHLYLRRNNYVHNAGRPDAKSKTKLWKNPSPFSNVAISTEAKRLRTKLSKMLFSSYEHVISTVNTG